MAAFVVAVVAVIFLAASFLPFFMSEAWGPLWGVGWWPAATVRSFGRVGPLGGVSQWAVLLAIPLSSALVLAAFTLVLLFVVLHWRAGAIGSR